MCSVRIFLADYAEQLEGRPLEVVSIAMRICFLALDVFRRPKAKLSINEDDPDGVEAMIRFMYGLDYLDNLDSGSAMLLRFISLRTNILFPG